MQIDLKAGHAPRIRAAVRELSQRTDPCLGCPDCRGLCAALVELMSVPDAVTRKMG